MANVITIPNKSYLITVLETFLGQVKRFSKWAFYLYISCYRTKCLNPVFIQDLTSSIKPTSYSKVTMDEGMRCANCKILLHSIANRKTNKIIIFLKTV